MVYSAEIRWFFATLAEAAGLEKWFNEQDQFFAGKWSRADLYLWQPALINQSVKIREGKVEVKVLLTDRGIMPMGNANSGRGNNWVKYSFGLPEPEAESENLLQQFSGKKVSTPADCWLRVDKERLLIKFALDSTLHLTKTTEDAWPAEGCGVELTQIAVNQKLYYTFGLEAFSQTRQEERNLNAVLTQIIPAMKINFLHHAQSKAYPEFLAGLYPS